LSDANRPVSSRSLAAGLAVVIGLGLALGAASCGGSSSETPPPLEPLPANVHYDRSATTLPGELGTSSRKTRSAAPESSAEPAPPPRRSTN